MNQQMQRQPVQWPFYRLAPTHDEVADEMGTDADVARDADQAHDESASSTVSKVVINGRVVLQNDVLQSTMEAMVRRAVTQESHATLN